MMFKGKVKINLDLPIFKLQKQLEEIATKVIRPDIQKRMKKGIDLSGNPHKQNTPATRVNKALRGLRTDVPLIASGQLVSSFRVDLVGEDTVRISPRGLRRPYPKVKTKYRTRKKSYAGGKEQPTNYELADILQIQGVKNGGHKYEFFGISDEAEGKSVKWMSNYIKKAIKDGGRRTVR